MTKRTGAIRWGRLFAASLLTVCGVAGCGRGPTTPSQPAVRNPAPTSPPDPRNPAPTILSVTPSIGSTGGGASIMITGAGLLPGVRVAFGATNVAAFFDPVFRPDLRDHAEPRARIGRRRGDQRRWSERCGDWRVYVRCP